MAATDFEWERPLIELEERIRELESFTDQRGIDLSEEITRLKRRADQLREEIFANLTPWQRVLLARHPGRPTTLEYIASIFDEFVELHGDRTFRDDPAMVGGIARLNGRPVTVIGPQKGRDTKENIRRNFGLPHPEGYRKAIRLMEQAERFGRPIITLIDVVGAYPGIEAEQRGQGLVIAEAIMTMSQLRVPIISVVTGEGGSGGALAIGVADRVWMLENAWYSVISPEMCAQILWKDSKRAPEAASLLRLTARDLMELGIIDGIVPEPMGGAHRDKEATARNVKEVLVRELQVLEGMDPDALLEARYQRYRRIGAFAEGQSQELASRREDGEEGQVPEEAGLGGQAVTGVGSPPAPSE
ncbi:acetyl-CoA carboxylase carboxyltransferase subunit alpha [Limnochorda sp.]|uniref:acetyl-CoA carboxylase carboxyltransferase subunit alpha n=1 Tax=Limnochorda sp. TaxID=1940279 RepID=UPI00183A204F|nr:acetyl-CoA carboxylase carboxyltransferase subunit alpha [Limnochorda pilosa]MBO2486759.1 acetyl-CoA carboxylase carboxyl transferase subunit alpha [Bacillota bacterium]MBO2519867.1 acetyl-CoA carboxylase carboxyl transferase subunit alpha [Bacillota bacterium]NMA71347.1 acetyl-CoA carboxylase carboxyltransferase subunit alpha [Bacillota bacterium]